MGRLCARSGDKVWGQWKQEDCPVQAFCVPTQSDLTVGSCECDYTSDMFENKNEEGRCERGAYFGLLFGLWATIALFLVAQLVMSIYKVGGQVQLTRNRDIVSTTFVIYIGSLSAFSFNYGARLANSFEFSDQSNAERLWWLFSASQTLSTVFVFSTLVAFGLTIWLTLAQTAKLQLAHERVRTVVWKTTAVNGVLIGGLVGPPLAFQLYGIVAMVMGLWTLMFAIALGHLYHVHNDTVLRLTSVRSLRRTTLGLQLCCLGVFVMCCFYAAFTLIGKANVDSVYLGALCMSAPYTSHVFNTFAHFFIGQALVNCIRARADRMRQSLNLPEGKGGSRHISGAANAIMPNVDGTVADIS